MAPEFVGSAGVIDSLYRSNFSFPGECYAPGETERSGNAFSGAIASSVEGIGDFDSESERDQVAYDVSRDLEPARSSSKRGRVAEFHNMSEKKRRQRINEKLKALQKLIPNSNKTDKASMLDDAIDYLRHLQLQVQMLAMRNGSSLHPFYMAGLHSAQLTPGYTGEEGISCLSRGIGSLYANQEFPMAAYSPDQYEPLAQETNKPVRSFALDPSTSAHCRPFNFTMSSKELCGDSNLQKLQLDINRCKDESSSGS